MAIIGWMNDDKCREIQAKGQIVASQGGKEVRQLGQDYYHNEPESPNEWSQRFAGPFSSKENAKKDAGIK